MSGCVVQKTSICRVSAPGRLRTSASAVESDWDLNKIKSQTTARRRGGVLALPAKSDCHLRARSQPVDLAGIASPANPALGSKILQP